VAKAVGIDLGTTNSCVAIMEGDQPTVIVNRDGERVTPSVVAFSKTGERLVGRQAKRQAVLNPERTISSIKRKMGTRETVTIDGKDYTPEQISAMILQKLKSDAEAYLGEEVKQAVITVPAYFNDAQRTATKQAGEIAGLEVLRIINLDVEITGNKDERDAYQVLATSGDTHLGGDDFDQRLVDYIAEEFQKEHGIDLRKDRQALQRLREAAEKAKCELSTSEQTSISLPFISHAEGIGPLHLEMVIRRGHPGGRFHAHSDGAEAFEGAYRQGAAPRPQPR